MQIEKGIIKENTINNVPFSAHIIKPAGNKKNVRTQRPLVGPRGLTIHNTGNASATADARNHASWLQNVENADQSYVGAHFFVDHKEIVQTLPLNEVAWHAGDGANGAGNSSTIGIEICETEPYAQAENNAIALVNALLAHYGEMPIYKHQDFTGKYCPRIILGQGRWQQFLKRVKNYAPPTQTPAPPPQPHWAEADRQWAQEAGLIVGRPGEPINWQEPVTLERLAVILRRYGDA